MQDLVKVVFLPYGTLLVAQDNIINARGMMISKYINPRDHFYSYRIPEDIINDHININLYKQTKEDIFDENCVHAENIGGD